VVSPRNPSAIGDPRRRDLSGRAILLCGTVTTVEPCDHTLAGFGRPECSFWSCGRLLSDHRFDRLVSSGEPSFGPMSRIAMSSSCPMAGIRWKVRAGSNCRINPTCEDIVESHMLADHGC
jgi:hypothetical protein